ncbi:MAG: diaminopimelate decarboxylase [Elusimicrobiales bacterium]|nr:diaminopimelate decarboxylase [Elusimicrobiales bacterium]
MWYFEKENKEKILNILSKNTTPTYIYHKQTLIDEALKYIKTFRNYPVRLLYAFKANSNEKICKILKDIGFGADVVSGGELKLACKIGFKDISFSGVGKTYDELELAIRKKISFINIESHEEFIELKNISSKLKLKANFSVRINPNISVDTHNYIRTAEKYSKFGVDFVTARNIYMSAIKSKYLVPVAIHFHLGSQIFNLTYYEMALKEIVEFVKSLNLYGIKINVIDIGGGLGVREGEMAQGHKKLLNIIKPYFSSFSFIIEPGRSVVAACGILVVKVLYRKKINKRYIIIVDGGMNNLIRPALYGVYHPIFSLNKNTNKKVLCDIVGPLCESSDYFIKNFKIALPNKGDYLIISSCGAYARSMASEYNLRCKGDELLI